jgi:hypothetical protein
LAKKRKVKRRVMVKRRSAKRKVKAKLKPVPKMPDEEAQQRSGHEELVYNEEHDVANAQAASNVEPEPALTEAEA